MKMAICFVLFFVALFSGCAIYTHFRQFYDYHVVFRNDTEQTLGEVSVELSPQGSPYGLPDHPAAGDMPPHTIKNYFPVMAHLPPTVTVSWQTDAVWHDVKVPITPDLIPNQNDCLAFIVQPGGTVRAKRVAYADYPKLLPQGDPH